MINLTKKARAGWRELASLKTRRRFLSTDGRVWIESRKTTATHRVVITVGVEDMFIRLAKGVEIK